MSKRKQARTAEAKPAAAPAPGAVPARLPAASLALIALAAYANSIGNGFIGDDQFQLLRNPLVTQLSSIPKYFGAGVWSFLGVTTNYYRPLPFVVYTLLYQLSGFTAPTFHLFMVLLHALNALLLFGLVRRMARARIAWAAAALFALHPIHTEAVDWIASLPDLLVTAIALTGLLLYARAEGEARGSKIALHGAIYLAALWTKETGVVLAALYFAYGFWIRGRRWTELRNNAALYASMAGVFILYLAMRLRALGSFAPRRQGFFNLAPGEFLLSAVVTAGQYLRMLVAPVGLNYFHVFHPTASLTAGFAIALVALAAVAAWFARTREALVAYGLLWMAAAIAPALNLTAIGQNVLTERYLYLPSAAFCWIAAWAWARCDERFKGWPRVAGALLLLASAGGVVARNRDWRDDFDLLLVTERQSPDSAWVHDALAGDFIARNSFDRALAEERLAVQYDPAIAVYRKKLGYILLGKDNAGAIAQFQEANRLEPGVASNHYDLATAYEAAGDLKNAADQYQRALAMRPDYAEARQGLARVTASVR